jgi:hypothetical protein
MLAGDQRLWIFSKKRTRYWCGTISGAISAANLARRRDERINALPIHIRIAVGKRLSVPTKKFRNIKRIAFRPLNPCILSRPQELHPNRVARVVVLAVVQRLDLAIGYTGSARRSRQPALAVSVKRTGNRADLVRPIDRLSHFIVLLFRHSGYSSWFIPDMRYATNDNDSWQTLGLATARLLLKIDEEHHPDSERDSTQDDEKQKKDAEREEYIAQRLRDIERFEQLYRTAIKGRS